MRTLAANFERILGSVGDQLFVMCNRHSFSVPGFLRSLANLPSAASRRLRAKVNLRSIACLGLNDPAHRTGRVVPLLSLLVITLSLLYLSTTMGRGDTATIDDYFFDPATGRVVVASLASAPAENGDVVRAYMYACGSCADTEQVEVRYVERITAQALPIAMVGPRSDEDNDILRKGVQFASGYGVGYEWAPMGSAAARRVIQDARGGCERSDVVRCMP